MSEVRLMLGNEAIARGAYEAGVKVSRHIREHRVQRLMKVLRSIVRYTASGRPMKRPH